MKKIRIIFIILTIIWMAFVFWFSNQPSDESKNTSLFITEKIVKTIYQDSLNDEELQIKMQELDYIIRKVAHYTLYALGGMLIGIAVFTYEIKTKNKILIVQAIGSFYAITDEIHQYFIPRKKCKGNRCFN